MVVTLVPLLGRLLTQSLGIPVIRLAQTNATDRYLNMSTLAAFFSSVTATTLQFSFQSNDTRAQIAVNSFWFCSLLFSIASAVNSLLGMTWRQPYV